eukprot:TRINITY_DN12404_c3_g2_i1.p2 TRINITY_DN12404_c3_g2~~TRINITY_DN12404_c3_g2_i1.p2  ORF type:complete len:141 (+),score=8.42 TRINITY_DN12404_c3_g2_i1:945-1367(+)
MLDDVEPQNLSELSTTAGAVILKTDATRSGIVVWYTFTCLVPIFRPSCATAIISFYFQSVLHYELTLLKETLMVLQPATLCILVLWNRQFTSDWLVAEARPPQRSFCRSCRLLDRQAYRCRCEGARPASGVDQLCLLKYA